MVWDDGEDPRRVAELGSVRGGEGGGEATDGFFVGVKELSWVRRLRERVDYGSVPVMMGSEERRLVGFGHVDDEGLWTVDLI